MTDTLDLGDLGPEADRDNITDWSLEQFHLRYQDKSIAKDDVWEYMYGVMHAPDWRDRYEHDLQRNLPRIPLANDFEAFRVAGRKLMDIHIGYEQCPELLEVKCYVDGKIDEGSADPNAYRIVKKMKYGRPTDEQKEMGERHDRSMIVINDRCALVGIPDEAHQYLVSGRTPLEWAMDSLRLKKDKDSGITDDPNGCHEWADDQDAFNLIRRLRQLAWLSVETTRVIASLPESLTGAYAVHPEAGQKGAHDGISE